MFTAVESVHLLFIYDAFTKVTTTAYIANFAAVEYPTDIALLHPEE